MSLKAFYLIPVIERIEVKIVTFEACGNKLYLGTQDGCVLCYGLEEIIDDEADTTIYKSKLLAQAPLSSKHSVSCLGAASGVGRLLALAEGILHLLDHRTLVTVSTAVKFKGITTFCLNHTPTNPDPFALEICVGRRRCLQLLLVQEDKVSLLKEVSCSETPSILSMDGVWACVATHGQYLLYNMQTGSNTMLFPYDADTTPLIRRIVKEEFLLDGPGGLGMFVTCDGVSVRPPINWTDDVLAVAYHHPYILTVTPQFLRIYSVVDQQVKQTLRFSGGRLIGNFDGQVYVASPSSVYCLMPQPWHKQVQVLLEEHRVEEAVELCEQHGSVQHERLVLSVLQRAGFLRMQEELYNQAADYFLRGRLDFRELLHLFPGVLPSSCGFVRAVPSLHQIVDLPTECSQDPRRLQRLTSFIIDLLMAGRGDSAHPLEVNTGLVKLLCRQGDRSQLMSFLKDCSSTSHPLECCVTECAAELTSVGMFVPLYFLYKMCGDLDAGMTVLVRLLRGDIKDAYFTGARFFSEQLVSLGTSELIMKYTPVLLDVDARVGVSVFTSKSNSVEFDHDEVLAVLHKFPDARLTYLHHIVDSCHSEVERYQTELVLHYAEAAVKLANEVSSNETKRELSVTRQRLEEVLERCQHYDVAAVLCCVRRSYYLVIETATLLGRLGEHEQALRLLVHQAHDFAAAEQYCVRHSKDKVPQEQSLFLIMLKCYLQPQDGSDPEENVAAPLELLTRYSEQLPLRAVLPILPQHWALLLLRSYFTGTLTHLLHKRHKATLQCGLAQCQEQQQRSLLAVLQARAGKVALKADSLCGVCCRHLGSLTGGVVVYPSGVVAHRTCTPNTSVCPLTGSCVRNSFIGSSS